MDARHVALTVLFITNNTVHLQHHSSFTLNVSEDTVNLKTQVKLNSGTVMSKNNVVIS